MHAHILISLSPHRTVQMIIKLAMVMVEIIIKLIYILRIWWVYYLRQYWNWIECVANIANRELWILFACFKLHKSSRLFRERIVNSRFVITWNYMYSLYESSEMIGRYTGIPVQVTLWQRYGRAFFLRSHKSRMKLNFTKTTWVRCCCWLFSTFVVTEKKIICI